MANSVMCTGCGHWIHRWCTSWGGHFQCGKIFVCKKCEENVENKEQMEKLSEEIKTVKGFCYLGDRLNANGGC